MHDRPSLALHISVLGPWKLQVAGESVPNSAWKSKKALSVFRYLLAYREHKVHKDTLINVFWPDEEPEDATGSLHTTIYFLRRMLQPVREAYKGPSFVRYTNGMYWFEANESCWIDVDHFNYHYTQGTTYEAADPKRALNHYQQALELYRGDFLIEEAYEDWAETIRIELRETYITLSLRAAQILAGQPGGVTEAVRICRAALSKDPFREELHQAIMAHLIRAGRYAEAAAQYRQVTALLEVEFDLPPSPETRALYQSMQVMQSSNQANSARVVDDRGEEHPYVCEPQVFDAVQTIALRVQKRHALPVGLITLAIAEADTTPQQIREIFKLLQRQLRHSDVVCHHDGEFRVLLLHSGPVGCEIVKRRVTRALAQAGLPTLNITTHVFEPESGPAKAADRR